MRKQGIAAFLPRSSGESQTFSHSQVHMLILFINLLAALLTMFLSLLNVL